LWDIRNVTELHTFNVGPHPSNKIAFDPSGSNIAVASNDGTVKLLNLMDKSKTRDLRVHDDSVQTLLFDKTGEYMVCGCSGTNLL
jgi:WD40 repeat protein